jgi:hypothetical protein
MVRSGTDVVAMIPQISRKRSLGVPVISETFSGV